MNRRSQDVCPDCGAPRHELGRRRCETCGRIVPVIGDVVDGGDVELYPAGGELWTGLPPRCPPSRLN